MTKDRNIIPENGSIWAERSTQEYGDNVNDGDYIIEDKEVEFGAPGVSVEST